LKRLLKIVVYENSLDEIRLCTLLWFV
jgi:hypothetical protein